jgi:hypothetical protein
MKTKLHAFLAAGLLLAGLATEANAAKWGPKELKVAQDAALSFFEAEMGSELFNAISGFSIERNVQGVAANAKILYVQGGVKKSVSLFCHEHGPDEIDCH